MDRARPADHSESLQEMLHFEPFRRYRRRRRLGASSPAPRIDWRRRRTADDEVDFSNENDLYWQIPNPYTEEYQPLWALDEDSGDSHFGGFDDVDDARCG